MRTSHGWLVKFGEVDFEGDVFTEETNFFLGPSGQKANIPVLYEHGRDSLLGLSLLGEGTVSLRDGGLWISATLRVPPMLGSALKRLARDRQIGWSSGAAAHLTPPLRKGTPNHVKSWAIAEASLTTRPAMKLIHSHAMVKRFNASEYVTELQARLALAEYERIAKEVERRVAF
jgi:hypothetical protein